MTNLDTATVTAMGCFRQFTFEDFDSALDGFLAIANGADVAGLENFPVLHEVPDHLITVNETEGEAAMRFLRQAGVPVSYDQVWRPLDEVWISIPGIEECACETETAH